MDSRDRIDLAAELRLRLARREEWRRTRLAAEQPGRQWLRDIPGPDGMRVYIVRRRFTYDDGTVVNRGEIILPDLAFWESRPLGMILFNDGYLEPLTEDTHSWQCPHIRFWATRDGIETHGCCDLPTPEANQTASPSEALPMGLKGSRAEILRKWRAGKNRSDIATDLGMTPVSVDKRIGELRKTYGPEWVPHRRKRNLG